MKSDRIRGRWAPSPTGYLHLGNARTALVAWLSVRSRRGTFIWREEDLDGPRVVKGMALQAMEDLSWLGLDWDEGPDRPGPYGPYRQSERTMFYEEALERLAQKNRLFPCTYSRKDLLNLASAPHGSEHFRPYPAGLRPKNLPFNWYDLRANTKISPYAIRFKVENRPVTFSDPIQGDVTERVDRTVGDFVLKRRDGLYAYQLAVVVDDLHMNISEVIRGADLLSSTARQIQLISALDGKIPTYAHVPLVVNENQEKLSKREAPLELLTLRRQGVHPEQIVGYLGYSLGLLSKARRCHPADLIPVFEWEKIPRLPFQIFSDITELLLGING